MRFKLIAALLGFLVVSGLVYTQVLPRVENSVPSDVGIQIRNVELDESQVHEQQTALRAQYAVDDLQIANDEKIISNIKTKAITAAHRDPATTDIDVFALKFVPLVKSVAPLATTPAPTNTTPAAAPAGTATPSTQKK